MSRYKIATKTDKLRYRIAKEVFEEIEDSDGVRDIPSWEIFEKCLEQHKRIAQLEAENDLVRNTKINTNKMECIHLQAEILELQVQLALTEKALELAVETMRYELGREAIKNLYKDAIKNLKDNLNMKFDTEMCDWFKEQAKEIISNDKFK